MFALLARLHGTNNLPDCSTCVTKARRLRCLKVLASLSEQLISTISIFGQNAGSNSPRMMHQLQHPVERGTEIISFNPLRE
jgi:hypothetical protein